MPADVDEIRAGDIGGICADALAEQADEGLVRVGGLQRVCDGVEATRKICVDSGVDAAGDGDEVGGECDLDVDSGGEGEFLLDLGEVAVFGEAVGPEGLV